MAIIEKTLQQKQAEKQALKTDWDTEQKNWEYVNIPEEDALGMKHATIRLNTHEFEAGETYLVPPPVAVFIKERLKVYNRQCVRTLQPRRNEIELPSLGV